MPETMEEKVIFDAAGIHEYLPHRYPFLLVDKVVEFVDSVYMIGIKNVTMNEPFFQGHFPGMPVMPGVMILEAMAQLGCLFCKASSKGAGRDKNLYFVGVDKVRWKKKVVPGDVLRMELRFTKRRGPFWEMQAEATVDGKTACSGILMAMETDEIK